MSQDVEGRIGVRGTEILAGDSRQQYRQKLARITLDSMVQFVGLLDARGTVLEINKVALDGVGVELSEVEGKPFWTTFWWQVSDEINTTLRESIARAARGEFVRWDTSIYGRAGGKETIVIDASLCPVVDDDGNVVFICAEGRDITAKKAQEREIAEKNIELQGLLQRIRELDEIKTHFFANVSHELRTPLALILGPAQRLIDDDGTLDLAQRREAGQVVARSARMLLKHVNDLLDISRLEAGKLKIELQDADVAALLRFLASHFAVLAADRKIQFTVAANEACVAAVDPDKLQRVLMNLLGNAFKFTPAGGRIRCRLRAGSQSQSQSLSISVEDSGPGVAPEQRQAIFERFRQGDGGIDRKVGGTGLGLAIAKEFVEMHKGRIDVLDSELGGACFQVSLPRNRLSPGTEAAPLDGSLDRTALQGLLDELRVATPERRSSPGLAAAVTGKPRVLVVEDNADMNDFVSQCLAPHFEVVSAYDGRDGLQQALRLRPTLVVSDIMMPNMSGVEMIAEMRKRPELQSMPIMLLSAKADEELMVKLLDDGAQDFIVKPFSERELVVRVRNLVLAQQAREASVHANRAKDEFLAMLGHELRNPLSPILTALQLMKLRGAEGSERELTVIERQVSHLTRLVDDLLDVSRIARGRVELKTELVEMADVVANAIEMASPLLEQRTHALSVEVPRRGLQVDGDRTRLGQVIANLLTNAAKYTPPGGSVWLRAERVGDQVVLTVRDTGMGIARDVLPHIFDLFVQERQALDRSQGGLGIGLTIVRNLVELHGGSVSARSAGPGKGTELTVRLPVAVQQEAAAAQPNASPDRTPEAAVPAGRPFRILIVDDNEDGAEMLADVLSDRGYETRVAHDAPTALRIAAEFAPDIAFLDLGLPVMDGYELAAHLRNLPGLADLQLIALT
ncbi:MAG TPA: ATP-binding protein, partial [Polyangiales bacterium]|nr:ATP-binding protein [Polyangiales bacterium]